MDKSTPSLKESAAGVNSADSENKSFKLVERQGQRLSKLVEQFGL